MTSLALIVGLWTTLCTQTQINGRSGHVLESYEITEDATYTFTREWFKDASCTVDAGVEAEAGELKLGNRMSGMFVSGETYELDFTSGGKTDLGAVKVKENALNFARGSKGSAMRNTMVGFFDYIRH